MACAAVLLASNIVPTRTLGSEVFIKICHP